MITKPGQTEEILNNNRAYFVALCQDLLNKPLLGTKYSKGLSRSSVKPLSLEMGI